MALTKRRRIMVIFIAIVVILIGIVILELNINPQFGSKVTDEYKTTYDNSPNFSKEKFVNPGNFQMMKFTFKDFRESLGGMLSPAPTTSPSKDVPVLPLDSTEIADYTGTPRIFWFGHSSFLLQIDGQNILLDPMLSEVASPYTWLGTSRFTSTLPISAEQLPTIDAVIISHDHYDHLDYPTIMKIKNKVGQFYTPLGVGTHLERWGIDKSTIHELDWWQEVQHENLLFRCTPSQHFSGRNINTSNSTLWASWVIQSAGLNIFFSGDSGYGKHFKAIGDKYGPFDYAMLECGQYNEKWANIHMFPEQTAQAGADLQAKQIMPMHWASFRLAMHDWTDPVERVLAKAKELNIPIRVPKIGEAVAIPPAPVDSIDTWWRNY